MVRLLGEGFPEEQEDTEADPTDGDEDEERAEQHAVPLQAARVQGPHLGACLLLSFHKYPSFNTFGTSELRHTSHFRRYYLTSACRFVVDEGTVAGQEMFVVSPCKLTPAPPPSTCRPAQPSAASSWHAASHARTWLDGCRLYLFLYIIVVRVK